MKKRKEMDKKGYTKHRLRLIGLFTIVLFLLSACGGREGSTATPSANAVQVQVKEADFTISSSVTSFTPGTTYHFVVTNSGATTHEFMIMPKAEGNMSGMQMGEMDKMALASIDTINPGETKTLDYTFPSSASNSHPQFVCYLPGHYEAGMKQDVTIKAS
jgi:uncharacterized cupredoxin-like copper-binding protein